MAVFTQWRHVCNVIEASLADVSVEMFVITLHYVELNAAFRYREI